VQRQLRCLKEDGIWVVGNWIPMAKVILVNVLLDGRINQRVHYLRRRNRTLFRNTLEGGRKPGKLGLPGGKTQGGYMRGPKLFWWT